MRVSKNRNMGWFPNRIAAKAGFGSDVGRHAENDEAADETREKLRLGVRPWPRTPRRQVTRRSAEGAGRRECFTHSEAERESVADGVEMSLNRIHSGSLKFAPTKSRGPVNPRETSARTRVDSRSQLKSWCAQRILAKVLHAGDTHRHVELSRPMNVG